MEPRSSSMTGSWWCIDEQADQQLHARLHASGRREGHNVPALWESSMSNRERLLMDANIGPSVENRLASLVAWAYQIEKRLGDSMIVHSDSFWYDALEEETLRQSQEWDDDIAPEVWAAVLSEECGEVAQAILNGNLNHAQEEIIQVAAICHRMFHSLAWASAAGWKPSWPTEPKSKQGDS